MSTKAADYGKTFMAGVFAKISDPEKRAQAEALFNDPAAAEAVVAIGAGALAQSDINKQYSDIQAKEALLTEDYTKLNEWYEGKKTILAEYDTLKAGGAKPTAGDPPARTAAPEFDPKKFVSYEDFQRSMTEQQMQAANYLGLQNVLTLKHYKDFGDVLDTRELLADKNLGKQMADGRIYGLMDAYQSKFSTQLSERDQKLEADRINKLVDEKVAVRMKDAPNQPFVIRGGGTSPLDALDATADPAKAGLYTADAAAQEYLRLQEVRGV